MKKLFLVIGLLFVVLFALYAIDQHRMNHNEPVIFSTWEQKYVPPLKSKINSQSAVEIAKQILDKKTIETITDFDTPNVEEILFHSELSIAYFGEKISLVGKPLYKITFHTTVDGLLGPIVIYIEQASGEAIGTDFRE